ncbi:MAG TPA: hypothetical protein VGO09_04620 [Flavisolibacter sp.]|jgi:hypothetical protein|nr:hypothetical protein [Flavisolibacter sp.]
MAYFKYDKYVLLNTHAAFDGTYYPGTITLNSGIYRCEGCGHEITSILNQPLPPQNHHIHSPGQGQIQWRLIVATTH